jgi:trigger factor
MTPDNHPLYRLVDFAGIEDPMSRRVNPGTAQPADIALAGEMGFGVDARVPLDSTTSSPGVWRSLVAHSLWERGAVGSNPATPTYAPTPTFAPTPTYRSSPWTPGYPWAFIHGAPDHRGAPPSPPSELGAISTVKSTVENLSPTRVRLAVEVPFEELKPSLDSAYKKIGSSVKVPGFRPGKVPNRVIDQRVGRAAVLEEAVNDALPRMYTDAVRENEIKALGQPEIDVTNLDDNVSLSFTAEVDIRPEIEVPDLSTLAVTVDDIEVTDADVDEQLDELRARFGTLTGVDRAVESGDFVALDLKAVVKGEEIEGGSANGLSYEVGKGDLIDGLDDAIIGTSAGDSATFATKLAQGERAGSDAEVNVTVNSVKVRELPDVDDEFAQLASEFDTVEELRADLRTRLGRAKALGQGSDARDKVLAKLIETMEFPVPESAVESEVGYREHDIIHSLGHDDALFEQFLAGQGKTREEFDAELREGAINSVKAQFILDAIADKEQVGVGDGELTEYLVRQAQRYNMSPQDFANEVMQAGNLPSLIADVRRNKALAVAMNAATITDESGNPVDLSALSAQDISAFEEAEEAVEDEIVEDELADLVEDE